jgi:hypothetical protein
MTNDEEVKDSCDCERHQKTEEVVALRTEWKMEDMR